MHALLACLILIGALSVAEASPLSLRRCEIVRAEEASVLYVCGGKLRSLTLRAGGLWQQAGRDMHGRFSFECSGVSSMSGSSDLLAGKESEQGSRPRCENEPFLSGFFISTDEWRKSRQDEDAIRAAFLQTPLAGVVQGVEVRRVTPSCPAFDVTLHRLNGRAACFTEPGLNGHAVIMVADDEGIGFVLSFYQKNVSTDVLKDRFLSTYGRFTIEPASGDSSLLRWFRAMPR